MAYVNTSIPGFGTPLIAAIKFFNRDLHPSSRVVRLLVDAGADTTSVVHFKTHLEGGVLSETPLETTNHILRERKAGGVGADEEEMLRLDAVRRLLMRVEAIRAVSWLWPSGGL